MSVWSHLPLWSPYPAQYGVRYLLLTRLEPTLSHVTFSNTTHNSGTFILSLLTSRENNFTKYFMQGHHLQQSDLFYSRKFLKETSQGK